MGFWHVWVENTLLQYKRAIPKLFYPGVRVFELLGTALVEPVLAEPSQVFEQETPPLCFLKAGFQNAPDLLGGKEDPWQLVATTHPTYIPTCCF